MLMLFAAATFSLSSCGKEKNELAHDHSHHAHEAADAHKGHDHSHHGTAADTHDHSSHEEQEAHGHDHAQAHGSEKHAVPTADHGSHDGADVIVLNHEAAERFGVSTIHAHVQPFARTIKVSGSIMAAAEGDAIVVAPTNGILTIANGINVGSEVRSGSVIATIKAEDVTGGNANAAAKAELDAAKAEWERVSALYVDRLVTQSQYNSARAAYETAKASFSSNAAQGSAKSTISGVLTSLSAKSGQYVEVGTPIATVAAATRLTLRADVPSKYYAFLADMKDARIMVPYSDMSLTMSSLDGRRLNPASAMSGASAGYVPVMFSFRNDGSLLPGTAVEVYLLGSDSRQALSVPRSVLSEQQGNYFVYVKLDADCYRKMPVKIGGADGQNVEILSGLHGGEEVVAQGVTIVRLAQSAGSVPSGHSHSH